MNNLLISIPIILALLLASCGNETPQNKPTQKEEITAVKPSKVDEIIAFAEKKKNDQRLAKERAEELRKYVPIKCSIMVDNDSCYELKELIAGDKDVTTALKKINDAQIPIMISYITSYNQSELILVSEGGWLLIDEKATPKEIRKFFGLE